MTKTRRTKRALLMSALSLLLCVSMLIGSTFAWFTDSVTSAGNKIQSGTLKVDLELLEKDGTWTSIKDTEKALFNYNLWEPGYTEVKILRVVNEGNLALKWYAKLSSLEPTILADAIDVYVNTQVQSYPADRNDLTGWKNVGTLTDFISGISMTTNGTLLPKDAEGNGGVAYLGLALKMRESAGNEYQTLDLGGEFDITIFATQYTYEEDSFNNQYDAAASWTGTVNTGWYNTTDKKFVLNSAEDLAGLAQLVNSGVDRFTNKEIVLGSDIDLNSIPWTPIGTTASPFNGKFNGNDKVISNLYVNGGSWIGLIGYVQNAAHIQNVVIDGAFVSGRDYAGAVLGGGYLAAECVKDCVVKDAVITATPYLMADGVTYDGGAKAGAVVGYAINGNITGNTAIDCTISAYRDLGGIAGMVDSESRKLEVSGNTVTGTKLQYLSYAPYESNKVNGNMGNTAGRYDASKISVANNDDADVERATVISYEQDGISYKKDVDTGEVVLYEVLADYENDTVNVPEGVTALGNYSFSNNANVKTVVLPSTVTALNRAFDSSTVETVVLNEGLEKIDSRAFRSTSALKEVVISSTVKKIADNAFQKSGIKEITIPANVETIGETAFGASKIETVIIEGNTSIQGYAFRGCPNLRTVYLCGDDVTFIASTLNGRNSMWFCNGESNNPNTSNITFYVANETVKQRVLTAMGAEANNTPVVIASIPTGGTAADVAQNLTDSLANGEDTILPEDLTFSAGDTTASNGYGTTGVSVKNGATLDGNGNTLTVTNANSTWDSAVNVTEGTIKNLTVSGAMRGIFMGSSTGDVYIDNVIFDDVIYTFNSDDADENYGVYISNSKLYGWTSFSNCHKEVVFTNCTFGEGNGYAFCRPYNNSVFVGCVFEEGFEFDTTKASKITFVDCYYGETLITAENATTLATGEAVFFYNGIGNVDFGTGVSNVEDLTAALEKGESIVLTEDVVLEELVIPENAEVDINLGGNELSVEKLEAANADVTISGGTLEHGEATYPAVSVNDGGKMVLNNVNIVCNEYCNLYDNGKVQAAEYVGLQVFGGVCELNNCNIEVNVDQVRYANSAYGISIHDGELIMNGGSVKVTSPGSTKFDYQAAFAGWQDGEKKITLNNVTVDAKNYFEAGGGNTVINTTDADGSWAEKCVVSGGTYTINYK